MKQYRLKQEERAGIGFTDLFVVTYKDLTTSVVNTPQSLILAALAPGDLVMNNCLMEVQTPGAGLATFNGELGVTGALTQFVGVSDLSAAGSKYFSVGAAVAPYPAAAAINLLFTVVPGAAEAVNAATAGEFRIWATINRKGERNIQV